MPSSPRQPDNLENSMSAIRPSPTVNGSTLLQNTPIMPSQLQATPSGRKPPRQLSRASGSFGATPRSPTIPSSPAAHTTAPSPPSVEPIVSLRGYIKVFHFEQLQSEAAMSLTVDVRVAQETIEASHSRLGTHSLRILFGAEPLRTTAEPLPAESAAASIVPLENLDGDAGQGRGLQLRADIPQSSAAAPHTKLSIQALVNETVIDAIDFGYFVLRDSAVRPPSSKDNASPIASPSAAAARAPKREREESSGKSTGTEEGPFKQHKRISSNIDELAPTLPPSDGSDQLATPPLPEAIVPEGRRGPSPPPPMGNEFTEEQTTMRPKGKRQGSLIRISQIRLKNTGHPEVSKVQLTLNHDLEAATRGWSTAEYESRRRLIQFWRRQRGSHIQLSFKAITPDEFIEGSNVVSCIFREETDECYITSVDLIGLLESLIGNRFSTEEKNRIRRNLEGFKPETMSKNKPNDDTQAFFSLIMSFGDPRPRNIEKDVKIFRWNNLLHALLKILSKYSYAGSNDVVVKPSADEEVSSEDELSERPAKAVKVEATRAANIPTVATRVLRTRASTRNVKSPPKPPSSSGSSFAQSPVLVKAEPQPSPAIAHRVARRQPSPSAHRGLSSKVGDPAGSHAAARSRSKQPAARRRAESLQGPPVNLTQPQGAKRHSLLGVEDTTMEESEVRDFLYNSAEFMGEGDEIATQPADSPPSLGSTTELDGIDGRSFQHPLQRQMQRERAEADIMSRLQGTNIPHDAPPVPAFLGLQHPPPHLQQQPRLPPQASTPTYPQAQHRQHLQAPPISYGHRAVRSESSLAHALDETYVQRNPAIQQPLQSNSPFLHQLQYPHSSPPIPMMNQHAYSPGMISPPSLHAPIQSPPYIKNEPGWDEEDPNDYLVRAGDDTNMSFGGTPAPDPTDWPTLSSPASYPYHNSY